MGMEPVATAGVSASYEMLIEQYAHQKRRLEPPEFDFLMAVGAAALKSGRVRQAIELTREALQRAHRADQRALASLNLSRLYRTIIQMNNARTEMQRGFRELGIPLPESSLSVLLRAMLFFLLGWPRIGAAGGFGSAADEQRAQSTMVSLYVEAGLSAYYLRRFLPFIQASLWSKKIAFASGESAGMAEWYGGTATVLAVLHMRSPSARLLEKGDDVARAAGDEHMRIKMLIWRALSTDYLGDPVGSAGLFSEIARTHAGLLRIDELNIVCTTLSCNAILRGHTKESLAAIETLRTDYDRSSPPFFSCRRTFVEWYRVPALSFHGETSEIDQILMRSRGVFSMVDAEKWQISQYLGNVLIHIYLQRSHDFAQIDYVFKRFEALRMSETETFLESCHYWVARAYLSIDLYMNGKAERGMMRKAVRSVAKTVRHPSLRAHSYAAQAYEAVLAGRTDRAEHLLERARALALKHDNCWALYELHKCAVLIAQGRGDPKLAQERFETVSTFVAEREWLGCAPQLDHLKSRIITPQ